MGLLRTIIRTVTRPARAKAHGVQGERKVRSKINPSIFNYVEQRQINNLIITDSNGKTHQIDHIVIRGNGIFCIETKSFIGWVFGDENSEKWTQTLYTGQRYQIYNPLKQNKSHCYHISRVIGRNYIVNSVVVMANNNADKINCPNVVNLNDLRKYLNNFDNGVRLSVDEMDMLYNKLLSASSGITNNEHIQNVRNTKREISQNICPRCGGALILRNGPSGSFYGCSNYPRCKFTKKA